MAKPKPHLAGCSEVSIAMFLDFLARTLCCAFAPKTIQTGEIPPRTRDHHGLLHVYPFKTHAKLGTDRAKMQRPCDDGFFGQILSNGPKIRPSSRRGERWRADAAATRNICMAQPPTPALPDH